MAEQARPRFVAITGMSGAGRRAAAHTLEDLGWYTVDNLPPSMLPQLFETVAGRGVDRVVAILDVRTRTEFDEIPAAFEKLAAQGVFPQILFLEASDEVIVRRQESSRRPLPLQGSGRLLDGIIKERRMISELRAAADHLAARRMLGEQLIKRILEGAAAVLGLQPGVEVHECDYRVLAA